MSLNAPDPFDAHESLARSDTELADYLRSEATRLEGEAAKCQKDSHGMYRSPYRYLHELAALLREWCALLGSYKELALVRELHRGTGEKRILGSDVVGFRWPVLVRARLAVVERHEERFERQWRAAREERA